MTRHTVRWAAVMLAVPFVYAVLLYAVFFLCVSVPFLIINGG